MLTEHIQRLDLVWFIRCNELHWEKILSRGCLLWWTWQFWYSKSQVNLPSHELCHVHRQYHAIPMAAAKNSHVGTNHFCKSLITDRIFRISQDCAPLCRAFGGAMLQQTAQDAATKAVASEPVHFTNSEGKDLKQKLNPAEQQTIAKHVMLIGGSSWSWLDERMLAILAWGTPGPWGCLNKHHVSSGPKPNLAPLSKSSSAMKADA